MSNNVMECEHELIDVYDEKECFPSDILEMAKKNVDFATGYLEHGKCKSKIYVQSYCKKCSYVVKRI